MADPYQPAPETSQPPTLSAAARPRGVQDFPWWFVALVLIIAWVAVFIITRENYREAFVFIIAGLWETIYISLVSYAFALVLGLVFALAQISSNIALKNIARLYIELIRGVPVLVLIFFIALVGVPAAVEGLNSLGILLQELGLGMFGQALAGIQNQAIPMSARAIVALSVTYGAFLSEIFRAGIQSIGRGQMEAGRSLGMTYAQTMRFVILPQAIRNVLPALGNDFVAMVKDSSLVSVLAVRDITQVARLYAGRTFRFKEAYTVLSILYLTMTVTLSLLIQRLEIRLKKLD